MRDPRDELRTLVDRGKFLIQEAEGVKQASRSLDPNVQLGVGVFDLAVGLRGRKRLAAALGKTWLRGNLVQRYSSLTKNFDQWYTETVATLRRISVARKNLAHGGNSSALVKRLATAKTYRRLDTQIAKAVGTLEAIASEDLVYNDEIDELRFQRKKEAFEELRRGREEQLLDLRKVAPELGSVKLENRQELRTQLAGHPEVARMIEGALDTLSTTGADANRQALASCRSAIELLLIEMTGETEWRTGLNELAAGTRKKLVAGTYAFLSGYGSHPGGVTTKRDAEYGIRMTIASCLWLLGRT
ncbi:MAG TPA: hypothetical protein VF992_10850 [Thermoplasmata archaeon]